MGCLDHESESSQVTFDVVYVRDDVSGDYPPEAVQQFIESSRRVYADLLDFDRGVGSPEASLHVLEGGLIIQFHFPGGEVVFLSMEKAVGRNFTTFIDQCLDEML